MKVERLCNFYACKYHLSIILLEYFKWKNSKKYKVITFLQDELEDEINVLIEKYRYNIEETKDINFKKTKDIYDNEFEKSKNMIFIVEGTMDYISNANEFILDMLEKNSNVKIINCYNFAKQKKFMPDIIKESDKILYTTGEKIID